MMGTTPLPELRSVDPRVRASAVGERSAGTTRTTAGATKTAIAADPVGSTRLQSVSAAPMLRQSEIPAAQTRQVLLPKIRQPPFSGLPLNVTALHQAAHDVSRRGTSGCLAGKPPHRLNLGLAESSCGHAGSCTNSSTMVVQGAAKPRGVPRVLRPLLESAAPSDHLRLGTDALLRSGESPRCSSSGATHQIRHGVPVPQTPPIPRWREHSVQAESARV